jgi:hypothetical protein
VFRVLLSIAALVVSTAGLAGGGVAAAKSIKAFKAGSYTKTGASLSTLAINDLRYASRAENVAGLLDLAQDENRINAIKAIQLSESFSSLRRGDELLLTCLKSARCQPDTFYSIAKNSDIHADVLARNPNLGATQVNHAVGEINERLMLRFFENSGWNAVNGQVGRSGFDGLLVKVDGTGSIRDLLIVESKFNTSTLKSTNHGTQMSDEWVRRKIQALRSQSPENEAYRQIENLIDQKSYRARLWNLKTENAIANIELKSIHSKGDTVSLRSIDDIEHPPRIIDMKSPKSAFDKRFSAWYAEELDHIGLRVSER